MTRVHVPTRRDERGLQVAATIPDHVEVLYELANGAPVHMRFSETTGLSRGNDTWIFGSKGAIRIDDAERFRQRLDEMASRRHVRSRCADRGRPASRS